MTTEGGGVFSGRASFGTSALWAVKWGALWGGAFGLWIVVPLFLRSLRAPITGIVPWLSVGAALWAIFLALGAALSFSIFALWLVWRARQPRRPSSDAWILGLATPALLPAAYFATGAALEWFRLGSLTGATPYGKLVLPLVVADIVFGGILLFFYRRYVQTRSGSNPARFVTSLMVANLIGFAALPYTASTAGEEPTTRKDVAPERLNRTGDSAPLLFVGIDGGNWPTLLPLIQTGRLPTLARLFDNGLHGEIEAPWPPYWSAPAWAAIVTGYPREQTRVYADLGAKLPGLPYFHSPLQTDLLFDPLLVLMYGLAQRGWLRVVHHPRSALGRPPFWELLTRAGLKTAVVRLPFTFPADGTADIMVSDWAGSDEWSFFGDAEKGPAGELVYPPSQREELLALFSDRIVPPAQAFEKTSPKTDRAPHEHVVIDPREALHRAVDIDERTLDLAEHLAKTRSDLAVLAVYVGGFDTVCHAFWRFRFPGDYADAPDVADAENFGPVIDRYLEYLDEHFARIIGAFPNPPNVIVVSDHGFGADLSHPVWKAWHSARGGIFLAAGPRIPGRPEQIAVTYFDVTPTILDVMGYSSFTSGYGKSILRR